MGKGTSTELLVREITGEHAAGSLPTPTQGRGRKPRRRGRYDTGDWTVKESLTAEKRCT